jgi:hypothetical protein
MSMQMDAEFKREQNRSLFCLVGALEGGFWGWGPPPGGPPQEVNAPSKKKKTPSCTHSNKWTQHNVHVPANCPHKKHPPSHTHMPIGVFAGVCATSLGLELNLPAVYLGLARTVHIHTPYMTDIFDDFLARITVYTPYIYGSGQPAVYPFYLPRRSPTEYPLAGWSICML